jgi:hypothetical protein
MNWAMTSAPVWGWVGVDMNPVCAPDQLPLK